MINHVASHKQVATNVSFKYGDLGWRRQTQMEGRLFHARWGHRSLLGFEFRRPAWVLLQCTHAHPPLPPPNFNLLQLDRFRGIGMHAFAANNNHVVHTFDVRAGSVPLEEVRHWHLIRRPAVRACSSNQNFLSRLFPLCL
jgi:hypothetical protein